MSEVNISQKEWKKIQRRISKLDALESAGVDNWDVYDDSLKDWYEEGAIDNMIEQFTQDVDEGVLVDGVDFDFPAGREAGISIRLNDHGEEFLSTLLKRFYENIKELEDE